MRVVIKYQDGGFTNVEVDKWLLDDTLLNAIGYRDDKPVFYANLEKVITIHVSEKVDKNGA